MTMNTKRVGVGVSSYNDLTDKPTNIDIVGANQDYATKEAIPADLRFANMEVLDADTDIKWKLEGGILDANWVQITQPCDYTESDCLNIINSTNIHILNNL